MRLHYFCLALGYQDTGLFRPTVISTLIPRDTPIHHCVIRFHLNSFVLLLHFSQRMSARRPVARMQQNLAQIQHITPTQPTSAMTSSEIIHKAGTDDGWHGIVKPGGQFEPEKNRYHLYVGKW